MKIDNKTGRPLPAAMQTAQPWPTQFRGTDGHLFDHVDAAGYAAAFLVTVDEIHALADSLRDAQPAGYYTDDDTGVGRTQAGQELRLLLARRAIKAKEEV